MRSCILMQPHVLPTHRHRHCLSTTEGCATPMATTRRCCFLLLGQWVRWMPAAGFASSRCRSLWYWPETQHRMVSWVLVTLSSLFSMPQPMDRLSLPSPTRLVQTRALSCSLSVLELNLNLSLQSAVDSLLNCTQVIGA